MRNFFITSNTVEFLRVFKGNLHLLSKYFNVVAISTDASQLKAYEQKEGIRTYAMPMTRSVSVFRDTWCLLRYIFLFLTERPQVVHGNTPKAGLLSMLAAWITRVPVRIYMCHGLRYQGSEGKFRSLLMYMEKLTCACASEVICVSHGVCSTLISDGICSAEKAVMVGEGSANGIDLEEFSRASKTLPTLSIREQLAIPADAFVFVFVGRMVREKGINELVQAFVKLQEEQLNTYLLFVGYEEAIDPILPETREMIQQHDHILAVGYQEDVRPYMLAADALVLPSYREGFGMVLAEAGALDIPCIATDVLGCNEVIIPGENGELIPPRDVEALRDKMWEWCMQPAYVQELGQRARYYVACRYDRRVVQQLLLVEYLRLVKSH